MDQLPHWWTYIASAGASVLVGFLVVALLAYNRRLKDASHWVSAGVLSITLYTLVVVLVGHWLFKFDVADTIRTGFSSERFSWLMISFVFDGMGRFYTTFVVPTA